MHVYFLCRILVVNIGILSDPIMHCVCGEKFEALMGFNEICRVFFFGASCYGF